MDTDIPACAGEVILYLVTKLSHLFQSDLRSFKELGEVLTMISKDLTGSSNTQVYIVENDNLKILTNNARHS